MPLLALVTLILATCGEAQPAPAQFPFTLVTLAPNASPTATPFQPSLATAAGFVPPVAHPSETPPPSATPELEPTATVDIATLFPTVGAPPPESPSIEPTALPPLADNETVNFLLIGSDKRPGASYRTDTLVIVIFWPQQGQASLISIPRDLWIYIPTVGMQRINTAYQSGEITGYSGGGPGLLRDTIAYNLGIHIDHTAMVEFDGFRRIVDTLGGIEVPISCAYTDWRLIDPSYDPYDENNWWLYSVGPGEVHMDGDLALWYARSRSKSSDFDRGRRQQEVLRSIFATALQTGTVAKIPQLYSDLSSTVITDIGLGDLLALAPYGLRLSAAEIRGYYIRPPYVSGWITPGGAAVQLPNEVALGELLREATAYSPMLEQRQAIRVEVQNGSTFETLESLAASRLNYAGYETTTAAADNRSHETSILFDLTAAQDPAERSAIAAALGLASARVVSTPDAGSPVEYRVLLGQDYDPCFQPQDVPR